MATEYSSRLRASHSTVPTWGSVLRLISKMWLSRESWRPTPVTVVATPSLRPVTLSARAARERIMSKVVQSLRPGVKKREPSVTPVMRPWSSTVYSSSESGASK